MGDDKPAGMRCGQRDEALRCRLFGKPQRPAFCGSLQPAADLCGGSRKQALALIATREAATQP